MSAGPVLSSNSRTIRANTLDFQGPDAYQQLLPYALDDICIEYSRMASVDKVYGFDAIDNMLVNLLYTRIGERDFEPEFGSNVMDLLFEPNDTDQLNPNYTFVEIEIYDRVRRWVPYIDITLSGILVQAVPEYQAFRIVFIYTDRVSNIQHTFAAFLTRRGTLAR